MNGRRRIKHNDGRDPKLALTEKRLTPSDIRRREARKAERAELAAKGLLTRQQPAFRCFPLRNVEHLSPFIASRSTKATRYARTGYSTATKDDEPFATFESPNSQQDLNRMLCMSSIETPVEYTKNRLAVSVSNMEAFAKELVVKGWLRI